MKKLLALPVAVVIFAVSACNKVADHIRDHLDGDDKIYRIERWDMPGNSAVITYNKKNDPVKVDYNINSPRTGFTDWWFEYNNKGRLSKCYRTYGTNRDDWYQKMVFIYDNKGRIAADTTFEMFWEPAVEEPYEIYWTNSYTYDTKGRITDIYVKYNVSRPHEEWVYQYDDNGNRVLPGFVYDNKLNVNRTNKIWMFVNREYSVNNPIPAQSYNERGLPLVFNTGLPAINSTLFLQRPYNQSTFTYKKN